jgi:FG-GAP-like repeat/Common central domain of tyrosinase
MGKRKLITDPSLTPQLQTLADKILQYVDDSVRREHANAHSWHHAGNSQFFDGHRQYIGKLEAFLLAQGLPQFVPLPKWDPATTIPGPFRAVKVLPAVASRGFGNVIANPSPNRPVPATLYNLTQFPSASALSADPDLVAWHANVHVTVGGVMRDIDVSPCAAVFWPWHAFIDDIYEDWIRRPQLVVTNFSYDAGGWRVDQHPRFLADLTGDGRADIIGFGNGGVSVALNNGDGTFQAPQLVVANFGYDAGGWRVDQHPRFLADLTGDGRADIIGFGNAGVWVSFNNGDGTFQAPQLVVTSFAYDAGSWRVDRHPRFLADLTGDGRAEIVGFGNAGVWIWRA